MGLWCHAFIGLPLRVFHASTASGSVAKTLVATVLHLGQNTCQPGAIALGLSILALLLQKGQALRADIKTIMDRKYSLSFH